MGWAESREGQWRREADPEGFKKEKQDEPGQHHRDKPEGTQEMASLRTSGSQPANRIPGAYKAAAFKK